MPLFPSFRSHFERKNEEEGGKRRIHFLAAATTIVTVIVIIIITSPFIAGAPVSSFLFPRPVPPAPFCSEDAARRRFLAPNHFYSAGSVGRPLVNRRPRPIYSTLMPQESVGSSRAALTRLRTRGARFSPVISGMKGDLTTRNVNDTSDISDERVSAKLPYFLPTDQFYHRSFPTNFYTESYSSFFISLLLFRYCTIDQKIAM